MQRSRDGDGTVGSSKSDGSSVVGRMGRDIPSVVRADQKQKPPFRPAQDDSKPLLQDPILRSDPFETEQAVIRLPPFPLKPPSYNRGNEMQEDDDYDKRRRRIVAAYHVIVMHTIVVASIQLRTPIPCITSSMTSDKWVGELLQGAPMLPTAKKFRYADISPELEEKLNMMFSSVVASGQHSMTPHNVVESIDEKPMSEDVHEDIGDSQHQQTSERAGASGSSKKRKIGKKKTNSSLCDTMSELTKSICMTLLEKPYKYTIPQALEKLECYPDAFEDTDFYNFVVTYLMEDKPRETFMSLPEGKNLSWLRSRYHA